MPGTRTALLIATDTYTDGTFRRLRAPRQDATALGEVLGDREIGGYRVSVLTNEVSHDVRIRVNELFTEAGRNDLILLYVSGHGIKDEAGRLHFATTDTRRNLVPSTAVPAQWVRELIDHSPARKVVVWLDCCFGGAFPAGMIPKAGGQVDVLPQLSESGRGCAVMSASTHIQFAYERGEDANLSGAAQPSVFTTAIVEGLSTGDADRNEDGEIDAAELYHYVYDKVRTTTPDQTPTRNDQVTGELYIARSKRGLWLHLDLPAEIRQNLRSTRPGFREAAIRELTDWAKTAPDAQRAIAEETLTRLRTPAEPAVPAAAPPQPAAPAPAPAKVMPRAVDTPTVEAPPPPPPRRPEPKVPDVPAPIRLVRPRHGVRPGMPGVVVWSSVIFLLIALVTGAFLVSERPETWLASPLPALFIVVVIVAFVRLGRSLKRMLRHASTTLLSDEKDLADAVFRPDGGLLVCAGTRKSIWDTVSWTMTRHGDLGRAVAFGPYGRLLASARDDGVHLWNGYSLDKLAHVIDESDVEALAFSPDGTILAVGRWDGPVRIWDVAEKSLVTTLGGHLRKVTSMAFSPDGSVLASASWDGSIRLWATDRWQEVGRLESADQMISSLAFSPDGTRLASAGDSSLVTIWSTRPWTVIRHLSAKLGPTAVVAFSPDGALLAHGFQGHRIRLVDTTDWSVERILIGHYLPVRSLAFSPDGRLLASTSQDRTLRLWDV